MIYYAIIEEDIVDGGFTVTFPDFPGCITEGDTISETKEMGQDALRGFIEILKNEGKTIPTPSDPKNFITDINMAIIAIGV